MKNLFKLNLLMACGLTLVLIFSALAQNSATKDINESLKIISAPLPLFTEVAQKNGTCGSVELSITFGSTSQISGFNILSSLPDGLTESAVDAATQIRFIPARKGSLPITVGKTIRYNFHSPTCQKTFPRDGTILDIKNPANPQAIFDSRLIIEVFDAPIVEASKMENKTIDEKAEAVLKTAIEKIGGDRYLNVKTSVGRGNFTSFKDGEAVSFSSFVDYIAFPDKERTEFKSQNGKIIQTNFGSNGWIFDGEARTINDQSKEQIADFQQSLRRTLDYLLRGTWRKSGAKLSFAGRRPGTLGKRNDAIKLTFTDGFAIDFEFASDTGLPVKSTFKRKDAEGNDLTEEERFAQIVEIQGIYTPFIIDHFINGKQTSRVNYQTIEFNTAVSDALFAKPTDLKKLK